MQADHPGYFPAVGIVSPDDREATGMGFGAGRILVVVEFVQSVFNGAESGYGIYFNAARYQFAGYLATDISFRSINDLRFGGGKAPLIVVELQIPGIE